MTALPNIKLQTPIDAADWISAIDFVNRLNWLFETWDVEGMLDAFLPEAIVYHFYGTIRGRDEMRRFFEVDHPYLVPGVSRNATNHIVDPDEDGLQVRYQNLLVRYADPKDAATLVTGQVMESDGDLPAIWLYSPMRDRLRRASDGSWKIYERYTGGSTTNTQLSPIDTSPASFASFMPRLADE